MNVTPRFKVQPIEDRKWLDFVRTQPCIVTGRMETEPAHLRLLGAGGMGKKPNDNLVLPLNWELHRVAGERGAWLRFANEYPEFYFRLLQNEAKRRHQMWKAT